MREGGGGGFYILLWGIVGMILGREPELERNQTVVPCPPPPGLHSYSLVSLTYSLTKS